MAKAWDDLSDDEKDDIYDAVTGKRPYNTLKRMKVGRKLGYRPDVIVKTTEKMHEHIAEYAPLAKRAWKAQAELPKIHKAQYKLYLQSDEWKEKVDHIKYRDDFTCRVCGARCDLQVHHLTYDRKYNESDYDLITVCKQCHEAIHALR